jgi:O-methyltransferase
MSGDVDQALPREQSLPLSSWQEAPFLKEESAERLYLDLLKNVLTRFIFPEIRRPVMPWRGKARRALFLPVHKALGKMGLELTRRVPFDPEMREIGMDWPSDGETMIGLRRLDNLEFCITDVLRRGVPGDLIETGVWRGGAAIFMRAALKAYGDTERTVWAADSFQGLPKPEGAHHWDTQMALWRYSRLAVSLEEVKANFSRYGMLDDRVRFLKGWFKDTLPSAPIERLAVLRLDGDLYESTMQPLEVLYPKLSAGGYCIVDDYHTVPGCKAAVQDYQARIGIMPEMPTVELGSVFWRKDE